ncbi:AhpC/TSA antioxidant enzyme-domain-containing protein [Lenzites betulinus]|nr:AhpC/TSA antioxidant enzyme-domain-containing protein [Lenzites betulinus]
MASPTAAPSQDELATAAALTVFDSTGKEVTFGSLIKDQKTIVVFIRHFFCGICQQYVTQLASVRKDALEKAGVHLLVIGCGDWTPIKHYCETTGFPYEVYADPKRALYKTFGLIENLKQTPSGQAKRSYITGTVVGNVLQSIWNGPLKRPHHLGKQGNFAQLGGDFVFGPGETCSYASRMQHTEDHVEAADLMKEAGVEYP